MPNEYERRARSRGCATSRRALPRRAASAGRAPLSAWPTMIDETIGSIGSTHGVSDSSRPAMKNAPTIGQNAPPRSTASMPRARRRRRWRSRRRSPRSAAGAPARRRRLERAPCRRRRSRSGRRSRRSASADSTGPASAQPWLVTTRRNSAPACSTGTRIAIDVAVGLDVLLERLVELDLAGGIAGVPSVGAVGRELELLAVEVVAGRDRRR